MGPPMPSRTTSNSPSTGEPSPGWTRASAPVARTAAARSSLPAWPVTVALVWRASWRVNWPTPPAAPVTRTRSPACVLARRRMPAAVTPATGRVAAVPKSQADGRGAGHSAGTTTRSAKLPPPGDSATTRSPTSKVATPSPRAATVPATSQPITVPGGCLAADRISPRLTEAASISSRSWPGPGAGSGTSVRDRAGEAAGSATSARMGPSLLRRFVHSIPPSDLPKKREQTPARAVCGAGRGDGREGEMPGHGRFRLSLGLAVGASLAFLLFLAARPASDESVKLTANLAQLLAPSLAAVSCAWAAVSGSGRTRRAWALLAASAASWAIGQATWVWFEHLARRELPFPSLADVGYLEAIPLAVAAMPAFPGRAERATLQARSLLDGAVIATSLLYTSWSLVLGPVFRAGEGGVLEQAIALAYPVGDVVLATIVFVVVARIRVGGAPVLLLGAGLLSLAVAETSFAYLTQEGSYSTGSLSDVGWFAGYLLVAAAARRPATVGITWVGRRPGRLQMLLPYCPLALAVATSALQQLRGQPTGPFLYWTFVALVLLIVGRQLLTVLDNQALNRRLAAMVGELEHQAFHDGLTNRPNRALFRERVGHALRRRSQAGTPLALLFIDLDDFKTVNDQLGHAAGDDLLVAVAARLKTCVRGEDTVARLGGDEFAILLEQASSHEVAVRVAGRILESMRPPFPLQGRQVQVGASVGVTVSAATEVDAVLREADVAMYTAKARGKGRYELATTSV